MGELIGEAKKNRLSKLRQAKEKAEEELKDFRAKEEAKFEKDMGAKSRADPASALSSETASQLRAVEADYARNKDAAIRHVSNNVLDVTLALTPTQQQALKMGMA